MQVAANGLTKSNDNSQINQVIFINFYNLFYSKMKLAKISPKEGPGD